MWPQQIKASCSFSIYVQATADLIRTHLSVVTCHENPKWMFCSSYLNSVCVEQFIHFEEQNYAATKTCISKNSSTFQNATEHKPFC